MPDLVNENDTPSVLSSYEYALDRVGNRTQAVDTVGTTTYGYDALYQLTEVTYPNDDEQSYTYDAMGNRLSLDFNETTTEYEYDAADQLVSAGAVSYDHDENGNQTERGSETFEWDYENRLTDGEIDSVTSNYAYNGDGLRTSRTVGANSVGYIWDVGASLPVILQDGEDNTYIYGLNLIARVDGEGDEEYYLYDGLGSVTGICDDGGAVIATYAYDVFGAARATTGSSPNEFTYTGEQNDPTGLEYLRARYYDNATGRMLSQDPVSSPNLYTYAANNPANRVDPRGLYDQEGGNFASPPASGPGACSNGGQSVPIGPAPPPGMTPDELGWESICLYPGDGGGGWTIPGIIGHAIGSVRDKCELWAWSTAFSPAAPAAAVCYADEMNAGVQYAISCGFCQQVAGFLGYTLQCLLDPRVQTGAAVVSSAFGPEAGVVAALSACGISAAVATTTGVNPVSP
ncbi:MAG: RHS repeat-associated core domain-containing protein [Dehalococcoidia bacterium]